MGKIEVEKPLLAWDSWQTLMNYVMFLELEGSITVATADNKRHYLMLFRDFAEACDISDIKEEYCVKE